MPINMLTGLIGARITNLVHIHDYVQLIADKAHINIYNPSKYNGNGFSVNLLIAKSEELENLVITKVIFKKNYCKFVLSNKTYITVLLTDESWTGPEAMDIFLSDGTKIVV